MGAYKYIAETLQQQYKERDASYRARLIIWNRQSTITPVEYPTNLTRARRLGYQAKQGYLIARVRVQKGRRRRRTPMGGRKPRHNYRFVQPQLSHQGMAEQRANRRYKNMEVLNSYWVGEDGKHQYFEVILADRSHPGVQHTAMHRTGRSFRGLTSAGKKSRGFGRGKLGHRRQRVKD
ncbi:MAG TPA: hypothetical protein VJH24_00450 [Candidatus Bilamarchaeaceae archaeon]|nr:hypothetical protein [Candidatus Bilamarchaeaceae archaeon]